jgi:predicted RNA methylase
MKMSKKGISVFLSGLKTFHTQKVRLEQYSTDSEIAGLMVWKAYELGFIKGIISDYGCGTGILGLGTMVVGGKNLKKVIFIDEDEESLDLLRQNIQKVRQASIEIPKHSIINKGLF